MVATRRNPGMQEARGSRNQTVTGNRRGGAGSRGRGRGRGNGALSRQRRSSVENEPATGNGRRSARERLGARVQEETSGSGNRHDDSPPSATVENDNENDREEADERHDPAINMQTQIVTGNVLVGPTGSQGTGGATPQSGASSSSMGLGVDPRLHRTPSSGPLSDIYNKRRDRLNQAKIKRDVMRNSVKELEDQLTTILDEGSHNDLVVKVKLDQLDQKLSELRSLDQRILETLCEDPNQQSDSLNAETREAMKIQESALCIKLAVLRKTDAGREKSTPGSDSGEKKRKLPLKLPESKVAIFDGTLENWPSWWGQFRILHESDEVSAVEKLQVLLQSMKDGSSAQEMIKHFPIKEESYEIAVGALKRRFGNTSQLVDALVQASIKLINEAASGEMDVVLFYDKLQTKLKTLRTLGTNVIDQCQYLHTQVVRALPMDIRHRWERKKMEMASCSSGVNVNMLDKLMDFLENEVLLLEQTRRLDGTVLSTEKALLPTAASLVATTSKAQPGPSGVRTGPSKVKGKKNDPRDKAKCLFCGKDHPTTECWSAGKMAYQEKIARIRKAGNCYICFKFGHQAKQCRSQVRCTVCGKRHYAVVCKGSGANSGPRKNQSNNRQQDRKVELGDRVMDRDSLFSEVDRDRRVEFNQPSTSRGQRGQKRQRIESEDEEDEKQELTQEDLKKVKRTFTCIGASCGDKVRLQTVQVWLQGQKGEKLCRAVLDTGAQKSAVTRSALRKVGLLQVASFTTQHNLYGGRSTRVVKHGIFEANIRSKDGTFTMPLSVMDESKIIEALPTIDKSSAVKLQDLGIGLTDFGEEKEVDLLLGNDVYGSLLTGETKRVKVGEDEEYLTAIKTHLGWVVSGQMQTLDQSELTLASMMGTLSVNQMFDLEVIGIKDPIETKSKKEIQEDVKAYFLQTVTRNDQGRYVVEWPWTMERKFLPNNFHMAKARLKSAAKRLQDSGLYEQYEQVFSDWLDEDIIEEIKPEDLEAEGCHYLPHRGVVKMDSLTTKLRPVFDASAKSNQSYSLNDLLAKGPNMLELIPDLIMRFMQGKVAAVSDIRKAFLQIELQEDQRDVVRFLWYEEDKKTLRVFRHKRVVFGVNCSPFLLAAVLEKHLKESPEEYRKTSEKLLESLYVDNCVASFETVQEYQKFKEESVNLLANGQFDLRMWESNVDQDSSGATTKVLGINWDKEKDTLSPSIVKVKVPEQLTKKTLLAVSHSLFDPTGMFAPVALIPKQLMREACLAGLDWDDVLPEELRKKFVKWCQEITLLEKVSIPRAMADVNPSEGSWSLHVFVDASKTAFAAVVYVRVETEAGVTVRFLQARTRLSPIKEKASIPRSELVGAVLGARLGTSIKEALRCKWPVTYWTDSLTVLQWLQSFEVWGIFVDNRVREIRALTKIEEWRHVPGKVNPADVPSRGMTAKKFVESGWLQGPDWLAENPEKWPKEEHTSSGEFDSENGGRNFRMEAFQERRKSAALLNTTEAGEDQDSSEEYDVQDGPVEKPWYENGETYTQVIKNLAYNLKAIRCLQEQDEEDQMEVEDDQVQSMEIDVEECDLMDLDNDEDAPVPELTVEDIQKAEHQAWLWIQEECQVSEKIKKPLKGEVRNGLWCVNTRLSCGEDSEEFQWPVYLPSGHPLVKMLIRETHERLSHAGPGIVVAELRKRAWIQQGRKNANQVIGRCVICRMHNAKKLTAVEAPLPKKRTSLGKVFETSGVDYGGPLYVRSGEKVYFALFTCATYRAVHLELVDDLTTEAFLQAFRRFRNRRGVPKTVCSDNGTNFRGLDNLMQKIDWQRIKMEFEVDRVQWDFNPPAAPWWGGFWERLVGIVKQLLRKILGNRVLDKEELRTALTDVEMVVNSRPLTYLGEKDDLIPLTPNSFLMDVPWAEAVDLDEVEANGFQRRYQYRQKLREELRQRFRLEYLGSLKSLVKNKSNSGININDIVLIEVENKRRLAWPIGRVVEVFPGRDGVIRLVKVRTSSGEMLRPIQRLVPLGTELLPDQEEKVKEIAKKMQLKKPEEETVQLEVEPEVEPTPEEYCTRSGRVSRQPDRLCYMLAGFQIID